jgi:hypothetical protein
MEVPMSQDQQPTITLLLSSAGFKGADIDQLLPPFETDYETTVGLRWFPSATGPETWTLAIAAGLTLGAFLKKFAELLATDIYGWSKTSLQKFFSDKPHSHGTLIIELDGVSVFSRQPIPVLASVDFLETLSSIDPLISSEWEIEYEPATDTISVKPAESS